MKLGLAECKVCMCVYMFFFVFQDSPWKGLKMEASHQISIIFMLIIIVAPSESGLSPGITDIAVDHPKTAAEQSESLSEGKNFRKFIFYNIYKFPL
jgi:hypothetical protein